MKAQRFYLSAGTVLLFMCCSTARVGGTEDVDVVFINGNIYTVNAKQPQAEAVAVKNRRIVFVGPIADIQRFRGEHTRVVDLHGRTLVPGLTDSHCHIFGIGEREMRFNLEGIDSLEAFLAKVKERVARAPRGHWIYRARLDRNLLETAAISDARRSGQDRRG